ncbi:hypothetical protein FXF65_02745 [Actinomadura syzygii]|uniref:Uncharacterized protein n=1 Tax=Actinomadura syzygii TaxID=1427538 RepID=A0A5D0UM24_9ACTN|nr:hypothetical protein FXF65_02745 [Actinomadura syzygii]
MVDRPGGGRRPSGGGRRPSGRGRRPSGGGHGAVKVEVLRHARNARHGRGAANPSCDGPLPSCSPRR